MSDLLSKVRESYAQADELAKTVSLISGMAIIPAHNELRNAGYHILKSIRGPSEINDDDLKKALDHCERATYDAAEVGLVTVINALDAYLDRFKTISLSTMVPDIPNTRRLIRRGYDLVIKGREHESFDLNQFVAVFRDLVEAYQRMVDHLPDLNAALKKELRTARRTLIGTTAVFAASAGAVLLRYLLNLIGG